MTNRSAPSPIRVATAALSERIFAGRPTKNGRGFKEPRYDVTSDVLQAIRDKVGIGNEVAVECNGEVEFRIAVLPPRNQVQRAGLRSALQYARNLIGPDEIIDAALRSQSTQEGAEQ
jgi:hypothetical protein